jgi:hypothetical protein
LGVERRSAWPLYPAAARRCISFTCGPSKEEINRPGIDLNLYSQIIHTLGKGLTVLNATVLIAMGEVELCLPSESPMQYMQVFSFTLLLDIRAASSIAG